MTKKATTLTAAQKSPRTAAPTIFELRIELQNIAPKVWRRVAVPHQLSLGQLHEIIQSVMPWDNSHMHTFADGEQQQYADPSQDLDGAEDEWTVKLRDVPSEDSPRLLYIYDFGDEWRHLITLLKAGPGDANTRYPICLAGKSAAPPEDCGGPPGYANMLEALADATRQDHSHYLEWIGSWDPETFDLESANKRLGNEA